MALAESVRSDSNNIQATKSGVLRIEGPSIVDQNGKEVILKGVSHAPYLHKSLAEVSRFFRIKHESGLRRASEYGEFHGRVHWARE
jgi:hypothetical protein